MENESRKILILLDQCPAHPKDISFNNVKFLFLPKNTTSVLQPLDLGVISCIKKRYKSILGKHRVFCDNPTIKYTLLDAMLTLVRVWEAIPAEVVVNYFKKSKIFSES